MRIQPLLAGEGDAVTGCTQERGRVGEALPAPQTTLPRRGPGLGSQRLWAEQDPCPAAPRGAASCSGRAGVKPPVPGRTDGGRRLGQGRRQKRGGGAPNLTSTALPPPCSQPGSPPLAGGSSAPDPAPHPESGTARLPRHRGGCVCVWGWSPAAAPSSPKLSPEGSRLN